uniref:START domain-containing protein n=1 Tax=Acrobeloides nanus TaxID=290746 RepID=A0A914EFR5_9BILA
MPSLFRMPTGLGPVTGLRRRKTISMPSDRERTEYHSMKQSLMMLIEECDRLVKLPKEISAEIDFSMNTVELQMPFGNGMTLSPNSPSLAVMNRMCSYILEEHDLNWKGWSQERISIPGVKVFTKEAQDKVPLKHFHAQITIAVRPKELFKVLLNNRDAWETGLYSAQKIISATHLNFEVQHVKYRTLNSEIVKQCHLARTWRDPDISSNCYILSERSICGLQNGLNRPLDAANRINVLQSIFLIVPVTGGMSELHHVSRIDLKGKNSAWYQNVFVERIAFQMNRLRENVLSIYGANGPETHL